MRAGATVRVLVFLNQKGGVGKTTTCVSLASAFALRGYRVLLADADPQANATTAVGAALDLDRPTLYQALLEPRLAEDAVCPTIQTNLFCLPASDGMAAVEVETAHDPERLSRLRHVLADVTSPFDFCFVDCPPSVGVLPLMAMSAGDDCIVPVQCEYLAMEAMAKLMKTLTLVCRRTNERLRLLGIVLTMVDRRTLLSRQVEEELRSHFGELVFGTVIPRFVRLAEAPSHGQPIFLYDEKSPAATCYRQLAEELAARMEEAGQAGAALQRSGAAP